MGNPAPGPKFDYKLRWFERLTQHAGSLLASGLPVVLAGDYNVMPTDLDVYAPERWVDDALFRPEVRVAYRRLVEQGWTDALRALHPNERIYTFWKYFRNAFGRDAGLRIDHLLLSPPLAGRLVAAVVDRNVRGREKASDHAPAWIELADAESARYRVSRSPETGLSMTQVGSVGMDEPITKSVGPAASGDAHPEEIRATVDLRIGNSLSLKATARTTPAGLVTTGIMVSAIILAVAALVRAARRHRHPKHPRKSPGAVSSWQTGDVLIGAYIEMSSPDRDVSDHGAEHAVQRNS